MPLQQQKPITYLITSGETTPQTTPADKDFSRLLNLIAAAVAAHVNLIQLREKNLSTRVLYDLTLQAAEIARGSNTRLLINDRADVARSAGAAGVHLTAGSIETSVIRRTFGDDFLIGVSTHSLEEARAACDARADFAVFGPVFETASKRAYGEPLGLDKLEQVATTLTQFPVLALGGVTLDNAAGCFRAGAAGVAAIRLMHDPDQLARVAAEIGARFRSQ
ncbi:MAG TPA: thiamine phosphate synthase [Pyrinomonadaceae bacterium]|nr:thiamine phosphate synthase [Pyrinomonadaceae bacterium]